MLVWQELPLTSSSTDNLPPDLAGFQAVLDAGLPPLLRHLRPHPCVVLLDAGNELTDAQRCPADPSKSHRRLHASARSPCRADPAVLAHVAVRPIL